MKLTISFIYIFSRSISHWFWFLDPFAIIINTTCQKIILMSENRYIFNLTKNGVFMYWLNYTNSFISEDINQTNSYCFEHLKNKTESRFFFFKCRTENPVKKRFIYPLVPKIVSCIFLILTIFIYFFLGETRSLFGKILINYCILTLFLFSLLCYTHRNLTPGDIACKFLGNNIFCIIRGILQALSRTLAYGS